ncbi:hypothetical protein CEXT_228931 [Caerostris extrusa]|uniref:Uncharacterized protein n=1 Tax=Caerostris extrusa TaxID=172846 RepID=A0AAV4NPP2_CAEEX|nr:hypothetical protein CEXT_228931 [Caerostris extrusa]
METSFQLALLNKICNIGIFQFHPSTINPGGVLGRDVMSTPPLFGCIRGGHTLICRRRALPESTISSDVCRCPEILSLSFKSSDRDDAMLLSALSPNRTFDTSDGNVLSTGSLE